MARKKKMAGGKFSLDGVIGVAKRINDLARETKIISKGLDAAGYSNVAGVAGNLGYGKKKRAPRKQKGGNFLDTLGSIFKTIVRVPARFASSALAAGTEGGLSALPGDGRRKKRRMVGGASSAEQHKLAVIKTM